MNDAVAKMLSRYPARSTADVENALREILQEIALLGLWRAKFFEKAAFYGGTALRVLHGLDRFSEDLDFSLLAKDPRFSLARYLPQLEEEVASFGFDIRAEAAGKPAHSAIESAFLKGDTLRQFLVVEAGPDAVRGIPRGKTLKIKLEVDTEPPPGFRTQTRYLLQPVPFAVRVFTPPDLFAGKMHALLCRPWKTRVKGRDWYDFVWYAGNLPELNLAHLESRMRQSGHWTGEEGLTPDAFRSLIDAAIDALDVAKARKEVSPFVKDPSSLSLWSRDFFHDVSNRVRPITA